MGIGLQGLGLLLAFGSGVLAARLLGPAGLGEYAYALAIAAFASIPAALGFPTALVRFLAVYRDAGQWDLARGLIRQSNLLAGGLGVGLAVAMVAVATTAGRNGSLFTYWLAAPLIPLLVWTNLRQRALQGLHHPVAAQLPEQAIKYTAFLLLGGALWLSGPGLARLPQTLMAVWLTASAVAFLAGAFLLRRFSPPPLRNAAPRYNSRQWRETALPMLVADSVGIIYSTVDIIMLGAFRPLAEVGLYQVAVRTAGLLLVFLTASNWVLAPWFAQVHAEADRSRLQHMVTRTTRMVFWPSLAVFALFVVAGRELLTLFFGGTYVRSWEVLLILAGARLFDVGSGPVVTLLAMTGGQRAVAWTIAGTALGNALGCWLLIPRFGMYGAAVSTALAIAVANGGLAVVAWRRIGIRTTVLG